MTIENAAAFPGAAPGPDADADAQLFSRLGYQSNIVLIPEIDECLWEIFTAISLRDRRMRCCWHAAELRYLCPGCADRVTYGAEALRERFATMKAPITTSVEAWASGALRNAVVDKHRRDRGAVGALQKDRVPDGLRQALEHDPLRVELARRMIQFVGTPHVVGGSGWPTSTWSHDLAPLSGDGPAYTETRAERDVARVLGVMADWNPTWLEQRILVPMGHKTLPVAFHDHTDERDRPRSADDGEAQRRDRLVLDTAADLLTVLTERLAVGDRAPGEVVRDALEEFLHLGGPRLTEAAVDEILAIVEQAAVAADAAPDTRG